MRGKTTQGWIFQRGGEEKFLINEYQIIDENEILKKATFMIAKLFSHLVIFFLMVLGRRGFIL